MSSAIRFRLNHLQQVHYAGTKLHPWGNGKQTACPWSRGFCCPHLLSRCSIDPSRQNAIVQVEQVTKKKDQTQCHSCAELQGGGSALMKCEIQTTCCLKQFGSPCHCPPLVYELP